LRGARCVEARAGASFAGSGGGKSGDATFQSNGLNATAVSKAKATKTALYIILWYGTNIWFNRQNKMLLNQFPCPWFIATMQLGLATHIHPTSSAI